VAAATCVEIVETVAEIPFLIGRRQAYEENLFSWALSMHQCPMDVGACA